MEKKDAELAIKISVDITELNEAIEKIKEITALCENSQQALDCMVQHIGTFLNQATERKTADYGEPCEKCKYIKACKLDWLSTMHPLLKKSSVKISVVHPERINTQDSDRKDPGRDKDISRNEDKSNCPFCNPESCNQPC